MDFLWQWIVTSVLGGIAAWLYKSSRNRQGFRQQALRTSFIALVVATCFVLLFEFLSTPARFYPWSSPASLHKWIDRYSLEQKDITDENSRFAYRVKMPSGIYLVLKSLKTDKRTLIIYTYLDLYTADQSWLASASPCERAQVALHLRDRAAQANTNFWNVEEPFTSAGFAKYYPLDQGMDSNQLLRAINEMDSVATLERNAVSEDRVAWAEHPIVLAQCTSAEVHRDAEGR